MSSGEPGAASEPLGEVDPRLLDRPEAGGLALRGSMLRASSYVAGIALSLVSAPLLIRHLGVARFGEYVTVISLVTIVAGFTEGGLNAVVLREYSTESVVRRAALMRSAIGIRYAVTLVGVLIAVGFAAAAGYRSVLVLGTAIAGLGLVLQLLQSLLAVSLQSELRLGSVSAAELVRQVVNVALLIALVLAGAGILPLLAIAVPASAVSLLFTAVLVRGRVPLRPTFHPGEWWHLLRESVPWAAISAVYVVYFRLAIILMSLIASSIETGYFATSFRIVEVLVGVPALLIGAVFPILARTVKSDRDRFEQVSGRLFELALLAGTSMVVCVEIGAPLAIHILAGHQAEPAIAVLRIQGLAVIATFVAMACGFPLLVMRRHREVLAANLAALVASPILTLALVPPLGARGAAIAALVTESGLALVQAMMLARRLTRRRLPWLAVPVIATSGVAACAAGLALPANPVVQLIAGLTVFGGLLAMLGRFPPELREILGGHWRTAFR